MPGNSTSTAGPNVPQSHPVWLLNTSRTFSFSASLPTLLELQQLACPGPSPGAIRVARAVSLHELGHVATPLKASSGFASYREENAKSPVGLTTPCVLPACISLHGHGLQSHWPPRCLRAPTAQRPSHADPSGGLPRILTQTLRP